MPRPAHQQRISGLNAQGLDALAQARQDGRDPAHGGQTGKKRSAAMTRRSQEAQDWDQANDHPDPQTFTQEILPGLRHWTTAEIAEAAGLSKPYCRMIRRGE